MIRHQLKPLSLVIVILATAAATEGAALAAVWTRAAVLSLAAFLLLEGAGLVPVWAHHLQRVRRERRRAAELVAALKSPAYAARVARLIREQDSMHADTVVLRPVPKVYSTVYRPPGGVLEEETTGSLAVLTEMDEEFNEDYLRGYAAAALDQETRLED